MTLHDYGPPLELARRFRSVDAALDGAQPAFLPGHGYEGQPVLVSEFGGLAIRGTGGWGWAEVADSAELIGRYREQVVSLMGPGPVEGFCYTQLADVEQERNGLLTADRRPKAELEEVAAATRLPKAR
jgi:hypothetical protein